MLRGFSEVGIAPVLCRAGGGPPGLAQAGQAKTVEIGEDDGRALGHYPPDHENQEGGTKIARILFVEYHSAFRQSASYMIDREDDMEVVAQAESVAEGREEMAQGGIDAAVVDVPLPDEGAAEFVRDLRDPNPTIPVLVLIHPEDEMVRERFLRAGASEVLPKSVSFGKILAAVGRLGREAEEQEEAAAG